MGAGHHAAGGVWPEGGGLLSGPPCHQQGRHTQVTSDGGDTPYSLDQGLAVEEQAAALGVYVGEGGYEGRLKYTHTDRWVLAGYWRDIVFRKQFIYYYDWGPNSGANWMFSSEVRTLRG